MWSRVDWEGGQCGNCLSWALTGIAFHRATQHVQIAGILVIDGATQDYFLLPIKILITHFIKSKKKSRVNLKINSLLNKN